jgi:L-lactate dehydrogenase complex protein LldG
MARDHVLHKVRTALGRSVGQAPPEPPEARIAIPDTEPSKRVESFTCALEKLAGKVHTAASRDEARQTVAHILSGRGAVASNAPFLAECGIDRLDGVRSGFTSREELRDAAAAADVGITSADYALADTGTLVMISSAEEARMISLLPPAHVAVVPLARLLSGLDELLATVPRPSEVTSSMVLITGPSRTADIEQILVRGVHGPGEIHVILV